MFLGCDLIFLFDILWLCFLLMLQMLQVSCINFFTCSHLHSSILAVSKNWIQVWEDGCWLNNGQNHELSSCSCDWKVVMHVVLEWLAVTQTLWSQTSCLTMTPDQIQEVLQLSPFPPSISWSTSPVSLRSISPFLFLSAVSPFSCTCHAC